LADRAVPPAPETPFPAWQVPVDFPLAAVSGVLNPRLILSSRVIDECPADELGMVLRHEVAHARRRDNLVHLGLLACPDLLGLTTWGNRLISNWRQAVEEAADEEAVGSDTSGRTALASALVRVARMAASGRPSWMPALALFDGHPLEARVRRLLTRDRQCAWQPLRLRVKVAGAFAVAAVIWLATGPRLLHACVEWGVRNLP
jgi:Zn-dependent protease with chaperone function